MKSKISILIVIFLMSIGVSAQIDRSQPPKPGPAPKIALEKPSEFKLKNGLTVMVVENHKLPRVSYSLTIDNDPLANGDKAGVESLIGAMMGNGTTSISKDSFNDEVDFLGANINFSANGAYASGLSKYAERILELMSDAAINPLLTEEEFDKEKAKLIDGLKSSEKSVDAIAGRVGSALSYGKNHPYGELTTEETVNNVTFGDAVSYYESYFNPTKAYLVIIGDVEYKTIKKQIEKYFSKWEKLVNVEYTVPQAAPNVQYTQINFIDMPNAVQSDISLTNNVDLQMKDPDYHAVLIANKILGGGFNSYLNMNLREEHGYTYGARSGVGTDEFASRFSTSVQVRNMVTDSAVVNTIQEIKRIKEEPVEQDALKNAKAKYVGDFVLALESPQTIARYALNIKLNELPSDFYTTYLQKINAVTVEDVMRVSKKYFKTENARIVIVGKGSEVLTNLEKTGIPIQYFDKFANPVDKPVFSKEIPADMTAQKVVDNYIEAIGGMADLEKVKSVVNTANVTIQGAPYKPTAVIKMMSPNKMSMEMSIEGMGTVMKQKFDGTTGYQEQQGNRMPMTEDQIAENKAEMVLFPELSMDMSNLSLESIVPMEGTDAYKIKVTNGDKVSFRFYDVNSGLLVREEATTEAQGQSISTIQEYSDYTEVDGVMMPAVQKITTGPQVITMTSTEFKINEDVTDADFK
ncbi:insulinase family protein [Subsaximicrobium wynnwilliamsii]|uniref:Insulinase family protein n=1 Tax=Subsaximicrobium wynnwilliamsii TaxID=291179 RepID=A0A5C6ZHA2_9FLAO|nr:pitrilysin family protein [Subsaximicrobium wynnwilliamsii]TXD83754.1 insulinase family protein [Subsaximicrobium wynnwilliamsii]TXD89363.1 insulinase family protein [Subsaximicrobium wynnwilliamsii]TXE03590.1 insulinase family protein [Subsaximicrobium wynnwilliamsii]